MKLAFRIASLPPDIGEQIRKDHPHEHEEVIRIVEAFIQEHDHLSHERVVRCIIYIAKRDKRSVASVLQSVSGDWRDAILWAEYDDQQSSSPHQVRDFNKTFAENGIQ